MTQEAAEMLAIRALGYLAGDHEQLSRFLTLTGIAPEELREQAASTTFLAGVLDFFLGDEPTLLAFSATVGTDPGDVAKAREVLSRDAG